MNRVSVPALLDLWYLLRYPSRPATGGPRKEKNESRHPQDRDHRTHRLEDHTVEWRCEIEMAGCSAQHLEDDQGHLANEAKRSNRARDRNDTPETFHERQQVDECETIDAETLANIWTGSLCSRAPFSLQASCMV